MSKSKEVLKLKVGQEVTDLVSVTKQSSKVKIVNNASDLPNVKSPGRPRKTESGSRSKRRSRSSSRGRTSRVTKSPSRKSPARSRTSKSRSPGPTRARSRSSSRRIATNKVNQQNSVSKQPTTTETKKTNEVEKVEEKQVKVNSTRPLNLTPTTSSDGTTREGLRPRMSARVAALQTARVAGVVTPGLISEGMEEVDSKQTRMDGKGSSKSSNKSSSGRNILGTFWAVVFTLMTPPVIVSLYLMCNKQSCSISKLPVFPTRLSSYFDVEAISFFFGWLAFQAILYVLPIGRLVEGQPLRDGSRLKYRMNGMLALVISLGVLSSILYYYPRVINLVYQKQFPIFITSTIFSYVLSLLLYIKSRWAPLYRLNSLTLNRSFIYSYFMGRELNPRPLGFDLKFFMELRPGVIGWAALNLIIIWKDYVDHGGDLSYTLLLSATLQIFYVADALWFEEAVLTTFDLTTEGFGFLLVFGDLSFVTLVFTTQSRFLLEHRRILPWYALAGIAALFFVGYVIFRASNLQKDVFRRNPFSPNVSQLHTINTGSPKKILAGGWWGWVRHPNYFGDLLIGLALCLPAGFTHLLPYSYFFYLVIILVHRSIRDDGICRQKYGAAWDEYCSRVRHRIVKYVF